MPTVQRQEEHQGGEVRQLRYVFSLKRSCSPPVISTSLHYHTLETPRASDLCLSQYYMANTVHGRGKSRQKGRYPNGERIPVMYWGQSKKRERDFCEPDLSNGTNAANACCDTPEGSNAATAGTELQTLETEWGWYRHTLLSAEVVECRYDFECMGPRWLNMSDHIGTNMSSSEAVASTGDALCSTGYTGPMCR